MPQAWDQEVIDPKQPAHLSLGNHEFPTVPAFARKENFACFDLETLFFAFYHQQGTQQQYLAAVELKKKGWQFNKKFETWFRKADAAPYEVSPQPITPQPAPKGKDVGKYVFFDFEDKWQQRVTSDEQIEMDLAQIENELVVQPAYFPHLGHPGAPGSQGAVGPATGGTTAAARLSQQQIQ